MSIESFASDSFTAKAIADGYVYECSCGELYNDVGAAITCRKCRNYCVFGHCTHVVDIRTDKVVAGHVPSQEEYRQAAMAAEQKWAEEREELDREIQMWRQEGPHWDAHVARLKEIEREAAEDALWALQDEMSGVRASHGAA